MKEDYIPLNDTFAKCSILENAIAVCTTKLFYPVQPIDQFSQKGLQCDTHAVKCATDYGHVSTLLLRPSRIALV